MATAPRSQALGSVSDTALRVACHRAMETRRPDALFRDPFAARPGEGRGGEVARQFEKLRAGVPLEPRSEMAARPQA